jgi:Cu/Ag efflux pump CusA
MKLGPAGYLARLFINSKLTPLIIFASILLGIGATVILPREEEPQIKVPMIDIFVEMPGASPKEVEERVSRPMEKLPTLTLFPRAPRSHWSNREALTTYPYWL